jgi:hypothetical protein
MIPIDIERKELEKEFMKMPEIESVEIHQDRPNEPEQEVAPIMKAIFKEKDKPEEEHKWLNDINTFQAYKNELCLRGTDEDGKDLTIWFDSYNFLTWVDKEKIEYIKETLIKYIEKK